MPHAQYLVSVSGGGYTAGAFVQALTDQWPGGKETAQHGTQRDGGKPGTETPQPSVQAQPAGPGQAEQETREPEQEPQPAAAEPEAEPAPAVQAGQAAPEAAGTAAGEGEAQLPPAEQAPPGQQAEKAGAPQAPEHGLLCDPATAFMVGTPEEDHLCRHSSYIASSPAEMLAALGIVAWHLLLTLLLLFGPAIIAGVPLGLLYRYVPVAVVPPGPGHAAHPLIPLIAAAALAVVSSGVAWLAACLEARREAAPGTARVNVRARRVRFAAGWLISAAVAVAVAVPAIMWVSSWLLDKQPAIRVGAPVAAVVLTYGASLATFAWKHRSSVTGKSAAGAVPSAAPGGAVNLLLIIVVLTILGAGWLLLFGGTASVGLKGWPPDRTTIGIWLGLLVPAVILGCFVDETTLSLHPFYRRRLASAFAVRRIREDGNPIAQAYKPGEPTTLSAYGKVAEPAAFPHVIFAASASLGKHRAPPGKRRVSYTFCAHWVGGPDVGYVSTPKLEKLVSPRIARDLTVQGAVAISGAAIAVSLSGQGSAWYEALFAITGARLGAWMPNPAFIISHRSDYNKKRTPCRARLPRKRRAGYLLRELFGMHRPGTRLIQVTDGGFYDNLGLVELFRRGCTRIYCIDASGDTPPAAATLAGALTVARHELGVEVTLHSDTWQTATPGSGTALQPDAPLSALSARLSQTGIITGIFRYPEGTDPAPSAAAQPGRLVVAKASLWPGLPFPLLAYAQDTPTFPRDSTADQWFDDHQYAAYTELGRFLGDAAVSAMSCDDRFPAGA